MIVRPLLTLTLTYSLFLFFTGTFSGAFQTNNGKIKIQLTRQKSPYKQYLEYGHHVRKVGGNLKMNRTNDSIALYRYLDNEFYGQIVIGGVKGQVMNAAFDTAWSVSWVISKLCNPLKITPCAHHRQYDSNASTYYRPNGTKFFLQEDVGNYSGIYGYENISVAHSNVTNFLFVEMEIIPDSFIFNKADGIMGLGLRYEDYDYEPFFYTLLRQKKIRDPIFSIYLNRNPLSKRGGNVMLGYFEPRHIHVTPGPENKPIPDAIKYLPVIPGTDYWRFKIDKIVLTRGKQDNTTICGNGCVGLVATSTNAIQGPPDEIKQILVKIGAYQDKNNRWLVNCGTVRGLIKIDFVLDGQYFRLNGPQYIMKESNLTTTTCVSAFVPLPASGSDNIKNTWVIGGAFLAQYYSIYDIKERTIGFVRAA